LKPHTRIKSVHSESFDPSTRVPDMPTTESSEDSGPLVVFIALFIVAVVAFLVMLYMYKSLKKDHAKLIDITGILAEKVRLI